jgi:hypothetical protein
VALPPGEGRTLPAPPSQFDEARSVTALKTEEVGGMPDTCPFGV